MSNRITTLVLRTALSFSVALVAFNPLNLAAQQQDGAGAVISGQATAKDVGLPTYPGSKPHKDKEDDSSAVNLGLWGGGAGFKLAVMKMESSDSRDKVASFYKKALSKYGPVLDCSNPSANSKASTKDDSDKTLTCDDDKPEKGGYVMKAGTKDKHHLVAIQPDVRGSLYQLVSVGAWSNK